jgi:hypothetical protein
MARTTESGNDSMFIILVFDDEGILLTKRD